MRLDYVLVHVFDNIAADALIPATRPTNYISIEFEAQWKFVMLLFITYSADLNKILYTSRQLYCRDVCQISLWLFERILNRSTPNLIEFVIRSKYGKWDGRLCVAMKGHRQIRYE